MSTSPPKQRIWILEDNTDMQFTYRELLQNTYELSIFGTISEFLLRLHSANSAPPELIIVDLTLPDGNFENVYLENRSKIKAPLIVISATQSLQTVRNMFNGGAMEYLEKPFSEAVLVGNIERFLKLRKTHRNQLIIDTRRSMASNGEDYTPKLTKREMAILCLLDESENRTATRQYLIDAVWGDAEVTQKNLDAQLCYLRKKIANIGFEIRCVEPRAYKLAPQSA